MTEMLDKIQRQEDAVLCLSSLNKEERKIFIEYYVDGKTLREIASTRKMTGNNIRLKIIKCKEKAKTIFNLISVLEGSSTKNYEL